MPAHPFIPPVALLQAYRSTLYRVHGPGPALDLQVGCAHPDLADRFHMAEGQSWVVITADNPGSRLLSVAENRPRQQELRELLAGLGLRCWPAENLAMAGDWPPENGFFATGSPLDRRQAKALGRQMGQNAVLFGTATGAAELLWCEEPDRGAPSSDISLRQPEGN